MGITSGQRNLCLELIQKMAYSMSETDYNSIYEQFVSSVPKLILEYFNKIGTSIKIGMIFNMSGSMD